MNPIEYFPSKRHGCPSCSKKLKFQQSPFLCKYTYLSTVTAVLLYSYLGQVRELDFKGSWHTLCLLQWRAEAAIKQVLSPNDTCLCSTTPCQPRHLHSDGTNWSRLEVNTFSRGNLSCVRLLVQLTKQLHEHLFWQNRSSHKVLKGRVRKENVNFHQV